MKRLLVLSGKGGTGKTTTTAAFLKFSQGRAFADCDVDAPNLHLVAACEGEPVRKDFFGSDKASIDADLCADCGTCMEHCRFGAIERDVETQAYAINEFACEGCGLCAQLCPVQAISLHEDVAGGLELYEGERVFSTARLKMGRGNSGKLVAAVKKSLDDAVKARGADFAELAIIDGSPGIGCPVIASISGVDLVLVVTEPTLSGRSDLERILHTAASFKVPVAVCINKWDASPVHAGEIEAYCAELGVPCVGKVPYDKCAPAAINEGKSIADFDCPARDALLEAYSRTMELLGLSAAEAE